jgi:dolichol-phosphate mannosyltransferase
MRYMTGWAAVIPMANEEQGFPVFAGTLARVMDNLSCGKIYFVLDNASKDRTLELAEGLSSSDRRFEVVWAPQNQCVVDAYLSGFRVAFLRGHDPIIEMDAGMSHDPLALPTFLVFLSEGYECAFGSRFIEGGSMSESPLSRRFLSTTGTFLANLLLGTRLKDMTSGFEGFRREVMQAILSYPLRSRGHFYQTEIRYLLRKRKSVEVPIRYRAPSKRVSKKSLKNAYETLLFYFLLRLHGKAPAL